MIICTLHGLVGACPFNCNAPKIEGRLEPIAKTRARETARKPADHNGVPMCSHLVCPSYQAGVCTEWHHEDPEKFANICLPEVAYLQLKADGHEDAVEPAFDEIVKLCGFAKTWEYPGQVIRDVQDVVKERDELREKLRLSDLRVATLKERLQQLRTRVQFAEAEIIRLIDEE